MKQFFVGIVLMMCVVTVRAQVPADTGALRQRVNTQIVANGSKGITAPQLNQILNGIITLMTQYSLDSAYRINDTLVLTGKKRNPIKVVLNSGGSASEVDPTVSAIAKALTSQDTTRWNNKQGKLTEGPGIYISNDFISAAYNSAIWNAAKLNGQTVSPALPLAGEVLKFDGVDWAPSPESVGGSVENIGDAYRLYKSGEGLRTLIPAGTWMYIDTVYEDKLRFIVDPQIGWGLKTTFYDQIYVDTTGQNHPATLYSLKDTAAAIRQLIPTRANYTVPATGIAASASVTNYPSTKVDSVYYKFSTTPYGTGSAQDYGGWLTPNITGDSIKITAPFWVCIGNSITEGHPTYHGRLHPTIDLTKPDVPGQISYHLQQLTNMRFFNHGIGGETSSQVWARWNRDVLGAAQSGINTLTGKPQGAIIEVGINDFYSGISVATLKLNLTRMAASCAREGIFCVMLTVPGDATNSYIQNRQVDEINEWLRSGALNEYNTVIVDFNKWWQNPAYNDNMHGNSLLIDDIHLTPVGYDSLANFIYREAKLPRLEGVIFRNELTPAGFSGYSRPANISFNKTAYSITKAVDTISLTAPLTLDTVWLKINTATNITGTTYSGFSHIQYLISYPVGGNALAKGKKAAEQTLYPNVIVKDGKVGVQTETPMTEFEMSSAISRSESVPVGPELRTYLNLAGGQGPNNHFGKGGFYIILPDGVDATFANIELDVTDGALGASKILIGLGNHVGNVSFTGAMASVPPNIRIGGAGITNMYIVIGDSSLTWDFSVLKINRINLYAGFSIDRYRSYDTVKVRFTTTPITLYNSITPTFTYPLTISGSGGSGSPNANIGSGFRLAIPGTNSIKTIYPGTGVIMDSTSNSLGLTIKVDTSGLKPTLAYRQLAAGNSNNQIAASGARYVDSTKAIESARIKASNFVRAGDTVYNSKPVDTAWMYGDSKRAGAIAQLFTRPSTHVATAMNLIEANMGIGGTRMVSLSAGDSAMIERTYTIRNYTSGNYIFLAYGTNDWRTSSVDTATYRAKYNEVLDTVLIRAGYPLDHVVVIAPGYSISPNPSLQPRNLQFENITLDLAKKKGVKTVGVYYAQMANGGANTLQTDSVHYNELGAQVEALQTLDSLGVKSGDIRANGWMYARYLYLKAYGGMPVQSWIDSAGNEIASFRGWNGNGAFNASFTIGKDAMDSLTTGTNNYGIGQGVLRGLKTGVGDLAWGFNTGNRLTSGNYNTIGGHNAGAAFNGDNNSIYGAFSAQTAISINNVSLFGYQTGQFLQTALNFSAFGASAGKSTTTANNSSYFGTNAGQAATTGGDNSAFGALSQFTNIAGTGLTSAGYRALYTANGAVNSSAFGKNSLFASQGTASLNSAFGAESGAAATTASRLSLFGASAANKVTTGGNQTVGGYNAMSNVTTGTDNSVYGYEGLLNAGTTSTLNLALGKWAGINMTLTNRSVFIGGHVWPTNTTRDDILSISNGNGTIDWFYGDSTGRTAVGGVFTPTEKLHVKGKVRIDTLSNDANPDSLATIVDGVIYKTAASRFATVAQLNDSLSANTFTVDNANIGDTLAVAKSDNTLLIKSIIAGTGMTFFKTDTTITINSTSGEVDATSTTTNATPTTAYTISAIAGRHYRIEVITNSILSDGNGAYGSRKARTFLRNAAGTLTNGTLTNSEADEYLGTGLSTNTVTITNSGTDIIVQVTGEASKTITHNFKIKVTSVLVNL